MSNKLKNFLGLFWMLLILGFTVLRAWQHNVLWTCMDGGIVIFMLVSLWWLEVQND